MKSRQSCLFIVLVSPHGQCPYCKTAIATHSAQRDGIASRCCADCKQQANDDIATRWQNSWKKIRDKNEAKKITPTKTAKNNPHKSQMGNGHKFNLQEAINQ